MAAAGLTNFPGNSRVEQLLLQTTVKERVLLPGHRSLQDEGSKLHLAWAAVKTQGRAAKCWRALQTS